MARLASVLTTVNAPHGEKLDEDQLVSCLKNPADARAFPGHMSSFFGEVAPDLQLAFAVAHSVSKDTLIAAAKTFSEFSGESYPLAA